MANQGMGKSMGNRDCGWVRARLPLWVDNGDGNGQTDGTDQIEANSEGGDLSTKDRREIERHLADCTSCRHYRTALQQALGALAVAAAHQRPGVIDLVCDRTKYWGQLVGVRHAEPFASREPIALNGLAALLL